jgi:hypothetical protein
VGKVDGKPFRSETTTLPRSAVVDWYDTKVPVVLSQYLAYLDGNITEVAIDRYAQADDGSVWYFGEDVIDYVNGSASFTEGTWLAGRDGPPAMIMPAKPKLGDVFRVENVIGIVFEELTVVKVDQTVPGAGRHRRGRAGSGWRPFAEDARSWLRGILDCRWTGSGGHGCSRALRRTARRCAG